MNFDEARSNFKDYFEAGDPIHISSGKLHEMGAIWSEMKDKDLIQIEELKCINNLIFYFAKDNGWI